jgi:hypothetical protein
MGFAIMSLAAHDPPHHARRPALPFIFAVPHLFIPHPSFHSSCHPLCHVDTIDTDFQFPSSIFLAQAKRNWCASWQN